MPSDDYSAGYEHGYRMALHDADAALVRMREALPRFLSGEFLHITRHGDRVQYALAVSVNDEHDLRDLLGALDESPTIASHQHGIVSLRFSCPDGYYFACCSEGVCRAAGLHIDEIAA